MKILENCSDAEYYPCLAQFDVHFNRSLKIDFFIESVEGLPMPAHKSTLFIQPHDHKKWVLVIKYCHKFLYAQINI